MTRGRNPLARLIGRIAGFPPAGEHDLHVHFEEEDGVETWTRRFSGKGFHSRLSLRGPLLTERFGLLTFGFELPADESGLEMILRALVAGAGPHAVVAGPALRGARMGGRRRFRFDVSIGLPLIGLDRPLSRLACRQGVKPARQSPSPGQRATRRLDVQRLICPVDPSEIESASLSTGLY